MGQATLAIWQQYKNTPIVNINWFVVNSDLKEQEIEEVIGEEGVICEEKHCD